MKRLLASGLSATTQNKAGITPAFLAKYLNGKETKRMLHIPYDRGPVTVYRNRTRVKEPITQEEFENKLGIAYIDRPEFEHPGILLWAYKRAATLLRRERIRKMNTWTLALYGKEITKPRRDHIYVRYIDHRIGYGVFANTNLPALTYIGEYTGIIAKRKSKRIRCNDYVFGYMIGPKDTPYIIDAQKKSNFTRFINHSYFPNMNSRWVIIDGIGRIILFTNRFVAEGTQLTYDYGKYYWKSRTSPDLL